MERASLFPILPPLTLRRETSGSNQTPGTLSCITQMRTPPSGLNLASLSTPHTSSTFRRTVADPPAFTEELPRLIAVASNGY